MDVDIYLPFTATTSYIKLAAFGNEMDCLTVSTLEPVGEVQYM